MNTSALIEQEAFEPGVPQTETEKQLAGILKEVLGTKEIGIHDRFTKIGGNSLNLITVIQKVREDMGVTMKSRLFFDPKASTVFKLSQEIDALRSLAEASP